MSATQQSTRAIQHGRPISPSFNGFARSRPIVLSAAKLLTFGMMNLPFLAATPVGYIPFSNLAKTKDAMSPESPKLWIYLSVALGLVLLGGAFAGLTIALMGQDEIYLQVVKTSGEGAERKHAASVLRLLERGKHWVLVTLLLGNVITNETLPLVLDRSLGGGWQAVLGSTVMIVIFGEIIPQSICVRYGLPIGAWMSPLVLVLMYVLGPVAWPTAKLLDKLLGEDHGTTYKKAGLKTLVTLHKTLGAAGEQLNQDEVTIISAVLDLKAKTVGSIMTPMEDVFTMSADTILNEETMDTILGAGYSRIPIYEPGNNQNYVGMLLVKILITYDPEDGKRVRDFALATLPETRAETSCLDIVNFFQEGKSHMVLVSEFPGDDHGALGVVTLEDVIEELIGEEIIDESDVYIDVHKAIRRMQPAPRSRVPRGEVVATGSALATNEENLIDLDEDQKMQNHALRRTATSETVKANGNHPEHSSSPKKPLHLRRPSSATGTSDQSVPKRLTDRDHLKHLGPSNLASRPRQTRYNTVKIKPGGGNSVPDTAKLQDSADTPRSLSMSTAPAAPHGGVGAGLLQSAGKDAKDGVIALQAGYGTIPSTSPDSKRPKTPSKGHQSVSVIDHDHSPSTKSNEDTPTNRRPAPSTSKSRPASQSTLGSLQSRTSPTRSRTKRGTARSGSITENIIDRDGIKKVVLETTSSSDDSGSGGARVDGQEGEREEDKRPDPSSEEPTSSGKKKRRRRKRKADKSSEEERGLLERDEE